MSDQSRRDVLPIPDTPFEGTLPYDVKDSAFAAIEPLRPPADAPNVLVILLDDVGFAASSAFGGPCATPGNSHPRDALPEMESIPAKEHRWRARARAFASLT